MTVRAPSAARRSVAGPIDPFVARHSPVALVLRSALLPFGGRYRLIEDYRFGLNLWRLTGGLLRILPEEMSTADFLREDRPSVRTAIVLEQPGSAGSEGSVFELLRSLRRALRDCGRGEDDSRAWLLEDLPLATDDRTRLRPVAVIVWSGDLTAMESLVGVRPKPLPGALVRAFSRQPFAEAVTATISPVRAEAPAVQQPAPDAADIGAMAAAVAVSEPRSPVRRLVSPPGMFERVVGTTRGSSYRRLLVRSTERGRRFVLLSAERRPAATVETAFFDRVGYAPDAVGALRALHAAHPPQVRAFVLEIAGDGTFRALTYGVRPLFWRASKKAAVAFPESRVPGNGRLRVIRGRLSPGDAVLILPRSATRSEAGSIGELLAVGARTAAVGSLTARLDALGFGKAMLVSKIG